MKPCLKPKASITTFTIGTRQLVVHEALEMIVCLAGSYFWLFTPMQIVMSSPLAGAEITTFLAPAARCLDAFSLSVNRPVLSSTNSTPRSFQGSFSGSLIAETLMVLPFTTSASGLASTVPGKRPCTESYFRRCASVFVSVMSLTPTNSMSVCFAMVAARSTLRPIRPNPLMPTRTAMSLPSLPSCEVWNGGTRERDADNALRSGALESACCFGERRARGEYVVYNDQCRMINDQ